MCVSWHVQMHHTVWVEGGASRSSAPVAVSADQVARQPPAPLVARAATVGPPRMVYHDDWLVSDSEGAVGRSSDEEFGAAMSAADRVLAEAAGVRYDDRESRLPDTDVAMSRAEAVCEPSAPVGVRSLSAHASEKPAKKARTLARLASNPTPTSVVCKAMLCLHGRPLKQPLAVHPVKRDLAGRSWVLVNEHQVWLRRACALQGSSHYEHAFQSAVSALRKELVSRLAESRVAGQSAEEQKKLRTQLAMVESDDDEGVSGQGRRSTPRVAKKDTRASVEIELHGTRLQMLNCPRPVVVDASPASIMAVIAFCQEHCRAGEILLRRDKKQQATNQGAGVTKTAGPPQQEYASQGATETQDAGPRFQMSAADCAPLPGKVTWHPSVGAWAVHYRTEAGKTLVSRIPVKQQDSGGSFADARRSAYLVACRLWDEKDVSKRERISA